MGREVTAEDYPRGSDSHSFATDMEAEGYELEHYRGYAYYEGPAVRVDRDIELQDIIRATEVRVKWDGLGGGLIIYPEHGSRMI